MTTNKSLRSLLSAFAYLCLALLLTHGAVADNVSAQISPDVSRYDSSDYQGVVRLSGHTDFHWYLQIFPRNSSTGDVWLFVNYYPIHGTYYNFGSYRWVQLDQYGAGFLYQLDLTELNSRGPIVRIRYFTDQFGNWITPGFDKLWEAI